MLQPLQPQKQLLLPQQQPQPRRQGREMSLLTVIVCLVAALHQAVVQAPASGYAALSPFIVNNQDVIIDKHNELRRGVNPTARNMLKMEWNPEAASNAQRWADQCKMSISPRNERVVNGVLCGENILWADYPLSWPDSIQKWYNQVANFKYGTGAIEDNASISSYTQVVWYNSYLTGCAVAYCPDSRHQYFYVCQYCPAGNNAADLSKPYKQGPTCGDCLNACEQGLCTNPCKYMDKHARCSTLKDLFGCNHSVVKENCKATCECTTEIR
ncbi:cysteine-rich venom protein-like isoform X2 [Pelodiscus sinensis]|uniref:cysteine-rich venom protein-like isoform X2 n=1 Tax=Pelodiscus sinensis TaxID=13735 RepID=UPI003F6D289D